MSDELIPSPNLQFEGSAFFRLLEHDPRVSRTAAALNGWTDWFKKIMVLESNEERCNIFEATFRLMPELANQKVLRRMFPRHLPFFPFCAMINSWPTDGSLPVSLLDQAKPKTKKLGKMHYIALVDCNCSNRDEVALWTIGNGLAGGLLEAFIRKNYSLEVVWAAAKKEASGKYPQFCEYYLSSALNRALEKGGPYLDELLLRFLWQNSGHCIDLSIDMPDWFREHVVSEASSLSTINLKWDVRSPNSEVLVLPTLRALRGNTNLTSLGIDCSNGDTDACIDSLYRVLAHCKALEKFAFEGCYGEPSHFHIPFMENLDDLQVGYAVLHPNSLEPMMSTPSIIRIQHCALRVATATGDILPDCYDGWARGLANNSRIETLQIRGPIPTVERCRAGGRNFLDAIFSRPELKHVHLDQCLFDDLAPADMGQFGAMAKLETLVLSNIPSGGLGNLLRAHPFNLLRLQLTESVHITGDDILAILKFLAQPKCRLQHFELSTPTKNIAALASEDHDDDRLRDPMRSLNNVLRDKNTSLTFFENTDDEGDGDKELAFWCRMNKSCPNRLLFRKQLNNAFPYQMAKYCLSEDYLSERFEMVRSTLHLWAGQ